MKTIKPIKKLIFSLFRLLAMLTAIFVFSTPAFAYEEDTHFIMTYVICRSVGFGPDEALIVAAVDQGMDDSPGAVANTGPGGAFPMLEAEWRWHALDGYGMTGGDMKTKGILARRDELFQDALIGARVKTINGIKEEVGLRNRLIRLGIFFHYQQDTWAHRRHYDPDNKTKYHKNHLSRDNYSAFKTPVGHAKFGHQPDRPPYDPVAALMCLEDGIRYAGRFLKEVLGREPNPFLATYTSQGGSDDTGWVENSDYVHQIRLSGAEPNSARAYLLDLIGAQISAYQYSKTEFAFLGNKASSEADFEIVRSSLKIVWNKFKKDAKAWDKLAYKDLVIPTKKQKEAKGFTKLTTKKLKVRLPDPIRFLGIGGDNYLWTLIDLDGKWRRVSQSGPITGVAVMPDGVILGVKDDNMLYTKATLNGKWTKVPKSGAVTSVAVMPDGKTILGVGLDHALYKRNGLKGDWTNVPNGEAVVSVTFMPDGTILGVGTDGLLKTKADLHSPWVPGSSRLPVHSVTVLQDGTILGAIGANKLLFKKATLDSEWQQVLPQSAGFGNVIETL